MKKKCHFIILPILLTISSIWVLKEFYIFLQKAAEKAYKHGIYYNLFNKWLSLKEEKKSLESFFIKNHINTIAIYGMGMLGLHLIKDLQDSNFINIAYAIDRIVETVDGISIIYKPDEFLPEVDMVVVTAIFSFDEVKQILREKVSCPVISIEEIIKDI